MSNWNEIDGHLTKEFIFEDFRAAMAAMLEISYIAEEIQHHPDWTNSYNRLVIRLRTHDRDAITELDRELADRIDEILEDFDE
jgi:4a-hydroxytetrahydrobiopterin dehydratase